MNLIERNSIRLRGLIHNNGVTFNMRDGTLGILSKGHLPAVVNLSPILGDGFRHNGTRGVWGIMNHLSTRVLLLVLTGKGNGKHGAPRTFSLKIDTWILHGCMSS